MAYTKQQLLNIIDEAARKEGVNPNHLKIIAGIESSFNPAAIGTQTRSGRAAGLFQFTEATAKGYGVGDRMDPVQAAEGAARYWKDLNKQFNGDLASMIAQYNGGNAGARAVKEGKVFSETADYMNKFNRGAKELGLADRIDTTRFAVANPVKLPKVKSFVESSSDIRAPLGPSNAQQLTAERKAALVEENKTFGDKVSEFGQAALAGAKSANLTYQAGAYLMEQDPLAPKADPDWEAESTTDALIARLEEEKIDRERWSYILEGSDSREGFATRLDRVRRATEEQANMAKSAGGAIAGALVGGALDPAFWLSGGAGALVAAGRATKTAKAVSGALAGGALDAGITATVGTEVDPNIGTTDIVINGLAGALGGTIGAFARGKLDAKLPEPGVDQPKVPEGFDLPGGEPEVPEAPKRPEAPLPPEEPPVVPKDPEPPVDLPEAPPEAPAAPKEPGVDDPIPQPPVAPRSEPWDVSWDTPERVQAYSRGGQGGDTLLVPPGLAPKDRLAYVLKYGNEREQNLTKFLQKNMQGLELVIRDLDPLAPKGKSFQGTFGDTKRGAKFADSNIPVMDELAYMRKNPRAGAWAYRAQLDLNRTKFVGIQAQKLNAQGTRKGVTAENLLHETVHSLTSRAVAFAQANYNKRGLINLHQQRIIDAYKDLEKTFEAVKKSADSISKTVRDSYGFTDTDEFLAEIASLPFERALRYVANLGEGSELTLWKKLAAGLRKFASKMLGKGREASDLLDSYYGAAARFIEESNAFRKAELEHPQTAPRLNEDGLRPLNSLVEMPKDPPTLDEIVKADKGGTTFGKFAGGFGIENILQNDKVPAAVRALGAKLVGTTAGYRGGEVVGRSAWEDTTALRKGKISQLRKQTFPLFEDWFLQQKKAGKYKGWSVWSREQALTDFNEKVGRVQSGVEPTDDVAVIRAVEVYQKWYGEWVDLVNNPGIDEGKVIKGLTMRKIEEVNPETGEVTVRFEGELQKDPNYMPFKLSTNKLNEAFTRFGGEKVHKMFEEAFYAARPELREVFSEGGKNYGGMFSKWYLSQLLDSRVNRKFDYLHSLETSASGDELVESMVNGGVARGDAEKIVEGLLQKNAGTKAFNSSLRHRATYDRKFAMTFDDGTTLRVSDLVDFDAGKIAEGYANRMSGAVGLAKNFEGVSSYSDLSKLFYQSVEREWGMGQITDSQKAEISQAFESAMNHILARPLDEPSNTKMALSALRDLNVATRLGGAVLYQISEVAQLVGTIGLRNVLRSIPELAGNIRRSRTTGKVASEELDAWEDLLGGAGTDMLDFMDLRSGDEWSSLNGYGAGAARLDQAQFGLRKAAGGLLKYTGMSGAMVIEKRLATIAITRHFQDHFIDGKALRYNERRLNWMGLDAKKLARVKEGVNKYAKLDAKGRRIMDVRGFAKGDPEGFYAFRTALQRELRRVVQENDLGSHIPAMDNGWFKTFTQFRSFVLQAHNKALLFGVNHADAQTATTLMYATFMGVTMQYVRAINKAATMSEEDRQEFLDKQLDFFAPGGVFLRGIASTSQAALMPQLFDTVSPFGNLFDGYRSTTDSSELWANPTADLISGFTGSAKQLAYAATGQDTFDQRDASQMLKLLPFNNAIGVSQALGVMTNSLPKSTKAELLFDDEDE